MWVQRLEPLVVCVTSSDYTGSGKNPGSGTDRKIAPESWRCCFSEVKGDGVRREQAPTNLPTFGSRPSLATKWRFCAWSLVRQSPSGPDRHLGEGRDEQG
jgi:hypothetical protein